MDSSFGRSLEVEGYQQRLDLLFADVCRCSKVLTVVSYDFLAFDENFGHLYYVPSESHWAREFHFKSEVRKRQRNFGW